MGDEQSIYYKVYGMGIHSVRYSGIPVTSCFAACFIIEPTLLFVITLMGKL